MSLTAKLSDEVRRGVVVQLRRGVYVAATAVPAHPGERHLQLALAEQIADPHLVASHATAALAWELPRGDERSTVEHAPVLSAPRSGTHRSGATRTARIHVVTLPDHHVVHHEGGLLVTSRARTAVHVAVGTLPELLVTLDAAIRAECRQIPSVRRRRDLEPLRIRAAGRSSLIEAAGVARPRDLDLATAIELADPRRETPIESLTGGHLLLAGLPQPIPQAPIATSAGVVYPDFLWPEHRLVGEAGGALKYQTPDVMLKEKEREQLLRDVDFAIVRWTGREIRLRPDLVMDRIARALAATG